MIRSMFVVAAALVALLAGPSGAVAAGPAPVINSTSLSTGTLTNLGGDVTVQADISSEVGFNFVWVDVLRDGHVEQSSAMNSGDGFLWEAIVNLPENAGADPITYQFVVHARDLDLQEDSHEAGEVEVAGRPPFDEKPIVSAASVQPTSLPAAGGPVTIHATASDTEGLLEVDSSIDLPGGGSAFLTLDPFSFSDFQGTFTVPANALATSVAYVVHVTALDTAGQSATADAGTVTVARRAGRQSRLKADPKQREFGTVRIGRAKEQRIMLRHEGDKRAAPLALTLTTSGAPFSVTPQQLTLPVGRSVPVLVRYAPTTVGRQDGTLTITRSDGGPPLVVALRGKAKR